ELWLAGMRGRVRVPLFGRNGLTARASPFGLPANNRWCRRLAGISRAATPGDGSVFCRLHMAAPPAPSRYCQSHGVGRTPVSSRTSAGARGSAALLGGWHSHEADLDGTAGG